MGKIDPVAEDVVPALIAALKYDNWQVREYAATALGQLGPEAKEAVPTLRALKNKDTMVEDAANEALKKIQPEE